jgi:hypothetical protein
MSPERFVKGESDRSSVQLALLASHSENPL